MTTSKIRSFMSAVIAGLLSTGLAAADVPKEWIEPATGHRVVRLTGDDGGTKLYFHQNAFTATGDKMLLLTSAGPATVDTKTYKLDPLGIGRATGLVVGPKSRQVYYSQQGTIFATHLDTHATREIGTLPPEMRGSGFALNADETLLAGSYVEGGARPPADVRSPRDRGKVNLDARWAAHLPMRLYTVEIKTGKVSNFAPSTEWLNHVQFSPTDPHLMMFCHEGPWHKVDRIWTIHSDGSGLEKIHTRSMPMEIAGHEFFSADGKTAWYDLQTPRSKEFWLAGRVLGSDKSIRYKLTREQWSVHYNVSPDGRHFAGDGGGPHSVAAPGNGQWIWLFTPQGDELRGEKLVDLSAHDYQLEPNVNFTPDGRWIVFQATMKGGRHVYAVEVEKK